MPRVSLVGHSMGSTVELVLLSKKPEYNEKIHVALTFAPVAIFTHSLPGLISTLGIRYGKYIEVSSLLSVFIPLLSFKLSLSLRNWKIWNINMVLFWNRKHLSFSICSSSSRATEWISRTMFPFVNVRGFEYYVRDSLLTSSD